MMVVTKVSAIIFSKQKEYIMDKSLAKMNNIVKKCADDLLAIDIPVRHYLISSIRFDESFNSFAFGHCHCDKETKTFTLTFADKFRDYIEDETDETVMNHIIGTVYHELIHTCEGAFNHEDYFHTLASKCNSVYNVNSNCRWTLHSFYESDNRKIHFFQCPNCGQMFAAIQEFKYFPVATPFCMECSTESIEIKNKYHHHSRHFL